MIGAIGGILALANIAPDKCVEIYRQFGKGDVAKGRALHLRMLPVNAAVTTRFGISGLKAAMDMLGFPGWSSPSATASIARRKNPGIAKYLNNRWFTLK